MATNNIATGDRAAHAITLTGGAADSFVFADNISTVHVIVLAVAAASTAPLYIDGQGGTAAVAGADTKVLAAVVGAEAVIELDAATNTVSVISAGAHTISVEAD